METVVFEYFFYKISVNKETGTVKVYNKTDPVVIYNKNTDKVSCDFNVEIDHFGNERNFKREYNYNDISMTLDLYDYFPNEVLDVFYEKIKEVKKNGSNAI